VPSTLALQGVGARKRTARILIALGLLSAGTAFVVGPVSFGTMRFLLGPGEAGFSWELISAAGTLALGSILIPAEGAGLRRGRFALPAAARA
jgi:hypothetical protein